MIPRPRPGRLDVLDVAEAVALEERHRHADLPHVLGDDRLRRHDRPVDDRLDIGGLHLGHHRGQVGGVLVIDFVGHDLDAVLGGESFRAAPCPPCRSRVARNNADLRDAHLLHLHRRSSELRSCLSAGS